MYDHDFRMVIAQFFTFYLGATQIFRSSPIHHLSIIDCLIQEENNIHPVSPNYTQQ